MIKIIIYEFQFGEHSLCGEVRKKIFQFRSPPDPTDSMRAGVEGATEGETEKPGGGIPGDLFGGITTLRAL
jgi:hypothetical protein